MEFLQPILLWGLPAVFLPLVIHLLNRLRYRQVDWAAMAFLLAATRRSTNNLRIRHWLLLASRMLIVLLIILALSRPLMRGRLGALAGGAPDTVLLLLDRSASMETQTQQGQSRREQALAFFAEMGSRRRTASSYVLIEHVERAPLELRHPAVVQELASTGPTDTAADIPALLRAAVDYVIEHDTGRTEILLATDRQVSNWKPDDGEWVTLREQLARMAPDVRVLLLDLSASDGMNMAVAVHDAMVRQTDENAVLHLTMDIRADEIADRTVPLVIDIDGSRLQVDAAMENTAVLRFSTELDLAGDGQQLGWGHVEIPADANPRDNTSYFVYGETLDGRVAVVHDHSRDAQIWRAAAGRDRDVDVVGIAETDRLGMEALALMIVQGDDPAATERAAAFAAAGGVVLLLPPGHASTCSVMDITWQEPEEATAASPFRVPIWDEQDGVLARTSDGINLPLDQLTITSRQPFQFGEQSVPGAGGRVLAQFADGGVFLEERQLGAGHVFVCSTRPQSDWSSLGDGMVLVPLVQRLIRLGNRHLGAVRTAVSGDWRPSSADEVWLPVSGDDQLDPAIHAGVFRSGSRLLALNRPVQEDRADVLIGDTLEALFDEVQFVLLDGSDAVMQASRDGSEIWYWLVCLALAGLVLEGFLSRERSALPPKMGEGRTA